MSLTERHDPQMSWEAAYYYAREIAHQLTGLRPFVYQNRDTGNWYIRYKQTAEVRRDHYRRLVRLGHQTFGGHLGDCGALFGEHACTCGWDDL